MKKISSLMLLALALFFTMMGCRNEADALQENSSISTQIQKSISSKLISINTVRKEVKSFSKFQSSFNNSKGGKTSFDINSNNILYRKFENATTGITTYTLPINSYSSQKPYYLIQQILVSPLNVETTRYLKIIPNNPPAYKTEDVLRTLTGSIEVYDESMSYVSDTNYINGVAQNLSSQNKSDRNISNKTSGECDVDIITTEVLCSNGNNHHVGQTCDPGFTNDAHFDVTIVVTCPHDFGPATIGNPGTSGSGSLGGGYVFDEQLNALLTNPTFLYSDYLTSPGHDLLLQAVRQWIPANITDINGDLTDLNNRLQHFANNDQIFTNLEIYNQNTPNVANAEVTDYSVRVYEMIKFLLNNPSQENGQLAAWGVNFFDQNRFVSWEQFKKWFIDGYDDTYKTKLSLLSSTEIQELVKINKEIDASLYDEEFVKETNEAFVAFTAYGDIDTMTDAQLQTVLNQCCPSIIVVPQAMTIEKSRMIVATYRFNRKFYPEWSKTKCFWEASRETIQLLLDLGGLAPVIGEVCDLTNGVIYTIQGDGLNASLSYASAIPVAGWFAAGSKYGVKVINASDIASRQVLKWIVGNDGLIKFGYSSQLRKVLKLTDATKQAHHIIPWAYNIQIHSVVQKAAKSADAFHLNEALNGIAVASWRNQPNHNVYNNKIFSKLELFKNSNPNATPQECYNFLNDLIGDVRTWIINHPNSHLNDLVLP